MKFDLEDRFIAFTGNTMNYAETLQRTFANDYLAKQIIRSSGSATLNFAEMQGTGTDKDYINKGNIAFKELKETELNLKVMRFRNIGGDERDILLAESIELIKILRTLINKRKGK
mgnify:CR=1 FL=1|jgi:four helix bundle protein